MYFTFQVVIACLTYGFTLAFGALFCKTWRIYRIFTNAKDLKNRVSLFQNSFPRYCRESRKPWNEDDCNYFHFASTYQGKRPTQSQKDYRATLY